jgi:GxxExxY protein
MENKNYLHSKLSAQILKAFYTVYNILGFGFLEKVYENSMMIELRKIGLHCRQQQHIDVFYDDERVGDYFADIIVEDTIIIELKAAKVLSSDHEAQLVNYLRATDVEVGLLLNFGKKPQHKRRVLTEDYK